jgi:hypothetical protein
VLLCQLSFRVACRVPNLVGPAFDDIVDVMVNFREGFLERPPFGMCTLYEAFGVLAERVQATPDRLGIKYDRCHLFGNGIQWRRPEIRGARFRRAKLFDGHAVLDHGNCVGGTIRDTLR